MKHQVIPTLVILLILLVLGWYIDSLAHKEITNAVRLVIHTLVIALVIALVGLLLFAILLFRERVCLRNEPTEK